MKNQLDQLESQSIFIIREAYHRFKNLGMLWSIGKDSTALLWLTRKAFFGQCPIPLIHIDTSFKIPAMIEYRDRFVRENGLKLIVGQNKKALAEGMNSGKGRLECCTALKTKALQELIREQNFQAIMLGIRRDEEGTRAKERFFSPRTNEHEWDFRDQPPELWNQFQSKYPPDVHVRVHPLLEWSELNIWEYIEREKIPVSELYFSKNGKRYRSLGCAPCTEPIDSLASTVSEIIEELKSTHTSERAGRAQDRADSHAMQKLRVKGYM